MSRSDERGVTLTELTIIGVLATIVMLALTGFYFNSQRMWMDTSTKAMAQRDATLIVETLRRRAHEASVATVVTDDLDHNTLSFTYPSLQQVVFEWNSEDSLLHVTEYEGGSEKPLGAIGQFHVLKFQLTTVGTNMLDLTLLELGTATGDTVRIASQFQLLGGDQP